MIRRGLPILALLSVAALALPQTTPMKNEPKGQHAGVNGLKMYYEVHGPLTGKPLVLLHGVFGTADGWGLHLPTLAKTRRVIVVEQQGHGHTPDRDTPLSYETMADDTAALMKSLKIEGADVFGYSDGGTVALALAIRHPKTVGKIAVLGACAGKLSEVYDPEMYRQFLSLPDDFAPLILKEPYDRAAPDPSQWPVLVGKIKALGRDFRGFTEAEVRSISAPTLILQGDHDAISIEGGTLYLTDENLDWNVKGPELLGGSPVTIHLQADDADPLWSRATEAGCTVVMPLELQFWGDKYGMLKDPYGHLWSIGQTVEQKTPEQIRESMAAMGVGEHCGVEAN